MEHNRVTLSYRGTEFFRAKEENRRQLDDAIQSGKLRVLTSSQVTSIGDHDVELKVSDAVETNNPSERGTYCPETSRSPQVCDVTQKKKPSLGTIDS